MRFNGNVFRNGKYWAIEVPMLGITTQGLTKRDAFEMIADAIETLVNKVGFTIDVFPGKGSHFEIGSSDQAALCAFLLRQQRRKQGLTLDEVTKRLGVTSHTAYARYEQGKAVPSIQKFYELLAAVSNGTDFILSECQQN